MTVLIGASVLLIAGSAIALVFGWTGADQSLIWTSIAATAAAAVALSLAYFRSRSELAPSRSRTTGAAPPEGAPAAPEGKAEPEPEATSDVIAVASTKKFHRPDCRHASAASGQKMASTEARKQGFSPCGVCKP